METIIKQARELGTSAGVLLPRSWLNKQVAVTMLLPSIAEISKKAMDILTKYRINDEVKGIYLFGSYSRGDYDLDSDIDILVITGRVNRLIKQDNCELLLISEENFSKDLATNLNYLSMLKEIIVIINKELIERYSNKKIKFNFGKIIKENRGIFGINRESVEICEKSKKPVPDGIVYSIVLRLRELYIMKCLLAEKTYSKKEFTKIVGERVYSAYIRVKRNQKEINNINPTEIKSLLDLSEKWLKELKR